MPSFSYLARDESGELKAGILESKGREEALDQLESAGFFPMEVEPIEPGVVLPTVSQGSIPGPGPA
ncbi:MAG: hypothetical protein HY581_02135 [Nitrospirae bacterium]|nr:hypothetical protein [Nitrospirota bacterium]